MFQSLLAAGYDGGTAGSIANTANWDQANKRFNAAMANPPGKSQPQAAPAPPPMPETPKAPAQNQVTISQAGQGVKRPGGKRKKTTLASLRIKPTRINQQVGGLGSGSGLNIGGYA
jgi:hypothetical protein